MPHRGIALPPVALFSAFRCCVAHFSPPSFVEPLPSIKPPEIRTVSSSIVVQSSVDGACGKWALRCCCCCCCVRGRLIAAARFVSLDDFPSNPLWRILPRHGETCDATHTELNVTKTVQSFLIQWFVLGDSKPRQATIYITPTFTS